MGGNGFIRPKAGSTSWLSHLSSQQEIRDSAFLTAETQVSAACAISVQAELRFTFVSCHHAESPSTASRQGHTFSFGEREAGPCWAPPSLPAVDQGAATDNLHSNGNKMVFKSRVNKVAASYK